MCGSSLQAPASLTVLGTGLRAFCEIRCRTTHLTQLKIRGRYATVRSFALLGGATMAPRCDGGNVIGKRAGEMRGRCSSLCSGGQQIGKIVQAFPALDRIQDAGTIVWRPAAIGRIGIPPMTTLAMSVHTRWGPGRHRSQLSRISTRTHQWIAASQPSPTPEMPTDPQSHRPGR